MTIPEFSPTLLIVPLAVLAVAALMLSVAMPVIEARARRKRRLSDALMLSGGNQGASTSEGKVSARRKAIEKTLKEIEEQQSARTAQRRRLGLEQRLREAGLDWRPYGYWLLCAAIALGAFAALSAFGVLIAGGVGLAAGLALPHFYLNIRRQRRLNAFAAGFPDVIDVIVRGVQAGRPLADCLAMVAGDSEEPHRSEFRLVVEDHSVGIPIQDAVDRLAQRVPLQEVGFLAVVVAIQSSRAAREAA